MRLLLSRGESLDGGCMLPECQIDALACWIYGEKKDLFVLWQYEKFIMYSICIKKKLP